MVSRQFQAFANPYPDFAQRAPYLVVLQSDRYDRHRTVVVAPLVRDAPVSGRRFRPMFEIDGQAYVFNMLDIGAMPRSDVGPPVADLDRFKVIEAYDALISGAWD